MTNYFDNNLVEGLVTKYCQRGCVDVELRNEIMSHAVELIRQFIRTQNFQNIYYGHDPASFGDLTQIAWMQIEKTLYKFDSSPGHTKIFNMWTQITKTVLLAHIKKEGRGDRHFEALKRNKSGSKKKSYTDDPLLKFIGEAKEMFKYDKDSLIVISAIQELYATDPKAHTGLLSKLIAKTGLTRASVNRILNIIRLRNDEFTALPEYDKPIIDGKVGAYDEDEN